MDLTRRCFLRAFGGVTAGVAFSPLPWKLLDDAAIWTQNWSWIARPPRGPVSWCTTTCTLCPAGCGLKLRRVGAQVVSAWAVPGHPLGGGTACAAGHGLAQLRYHPARVTGALRRFERDGATVRRPVPLDDALDEVGRRLAELRATDRACGVAVIDPAPGRALSLLHREFLDRVGGGCLLTVEDGRTATARVLGGLLAAPGMVPGCDFAASRAVVSFGAPLRGGWAGAGPAAGLRAGEDAPFVVQVQPCASFDSERADRWLACRPGGEAAVALGLAGRVAALRGDARWQDLLAPFTPERCARAADIAPQQLLDTARELAARGPGLALAGDPGAGPFAPATTEAVAILALVLAGEPNRGGLVLRRAPATLFPHEPATATTRLADLPDGSLDLVIIDASRPGAALPRRLLQRKLRGPRSLVVALASTITGPATQADLILPCVAPGEWRDDILAAPLASRTSYAWSAAVLPPRPGACHPADLLDRMARAAGVAPAEAGRDRHAAVLRDRAAALAAAGRGEIFDPAAGRAQSPPPWTTADTLAALLARGACWSDPGAPAPARGLHLPADPGLPERLAAAVDGTDRPADSRAFALDLVVDGRPEACGAGALPPVVTKLYRESELRPDGRCARLNPRTIRTLGLRPDRPAELTTAAGGLPVRVVPDEAVRPGVVQVAAGPLPCDLGDPDDGRGGILDICDVTTQGTWRLGRAALREV